MRDEGRSGQADEGAGQQTPHAVIDGRYELREPVGSGGMGEVWKAYDLRLRRFVAVKGLLDRTAVTAETQKAAMQRARREAEAIAKIEHQNVVTVHDQVETDNQVWIVMKLLEARSLADLLRRERVLGVPRAADIGLQILQGLRAVHRAEVLHRDVKPGNVLVREDGLAILVDFGIATFAGADRVTRHGSVIGTPAYMAPELFATASPGPTPASDLWALGVTLYEMAEGRLPFQGREVWEVQESIRSTPEPPYRYAGPLAPVIQGLLAPTKGERLDAAMAEAMLREVLREPDVPDAAVAAPPTQVDTPDTPDPEVPFVFAEEKHPAAEAQGRGRGRGWKAAVAVVVAALLAGGGWLLSQGAGGGDPAGPTPGGAGGKGGQAAQEQWEQWRKEHRILKIGVKYDQPGVGFRDGKRYRGFDIDMAYAIADAMGYGRNEVKLFPVTTWNRSSLLTAVDLVIASYTITEKRMKGEKVEFVGPYYTAGRTFLVRKHSQKYELEEAADLKEHKVEVCTAQGSTYENLGEEGFTMRPSQPATYRKCVDELLDPGSGVYAVASDDVVLAGLADGRQGEVKLLENGRGTEDYGIAMRKGEEILRNEVCLALQQVLSTDAWDVMYEKHLAPLMKGRPKPRQPESPNCASK
ncbi:serine/threonine-protein kinase [Streptomyces sp. BBFR102]|uniref:serine/threonine-protein kinase n=1 Tax=Streptomyces sp. BBFR102 TaxID=3448171 RepID=UPI003F530447